jgi:hypothetical protein
MFPSVWKFLDSYKELITTGLDLLSFILITPEALRFFGTQLKWAAYFTVAWIVFTSCSVVFGLLLTVFSSLSGAGIGWNTILSIIWIVGVMMFLRKTDVISDILVVKIEPWFAEHMFIVGACVFMFTRTFAFIVSLHHAYVQ